MSMIRRAVTGKIENFTDENDDRAVVCQACNRIIVSKTNLGNNNTCPFCHNDVSLAINNTNLMVEAEPDDIAESV